MNKKLLVVIVLAVLVLLGGYAYTQGWFNGSLMGQTPTDTTSDENTVPQGKRAAYEWSFAETEADANGTPHTTVTLKSGTKVTEVGTYAGTCREVPAGERGVANDMADEGEVSRVQCWFAGSGDEIGVFESGPTAVVKVGEIGEGSPEEPFFRGNFKTLITL